MTLFDVLQYLMTLCDTLKYLRFFANKHMKAPSSTFKHLQVGCGKSKTMYKYIKKKHHVRTQRDWIFDPGFFQ